MGASVLNIHWPACVFLCLCGGVVAGVLSVVLIEACCWEWLSGGER